MQLITFGRLALEGGGLTRQKPLLLLAYLAVEGAKPRRHLAELFFAETNDPLNSLSRALSNLRKEAPGSVEADATRAWTVIESDAVRFIGHADAGELAGCETLYRGTFADDLTVELSPELEEWVLGTREYLAGRQRDVLLRLGEAKLGERQPKRAASYAERAYTLAGAAELEPEQLGRVYRLLSAGNSPRAAGVREEAETFGVPLPVAPPVQAEEEAAAHNLPLPKSSFVGRDGELLEIAGQLARPECRLLTLHGTGGVGKSRLAVQAAYRAVAAGAFRDGLYFVPLAALSAAGLIPSSIAEALSLPLQGQESTLTQVVRHLGDKHVLLVLDNYEHLMDGATLPATLLDGCPNLKIVVTSRERLNLEEEWVLRLEGLAVPDGGAEGLERAQRYDALNLFVQRARRSRLDFTLTDEDLPHALKICRLVDGFPLGIELAAVWVKLLPLAEIAGEIEKNVDMLAGSSRNAPERHQSIRAVFEHSWELLTPREQDVLKKFSFFVGGFRREAAAEVAGATLSVLASLVDKSLIRVTTGGRYYRHPLLFQFVRAKARNTLEDFSATRQKHADFYFRYLLCQSDALFSADQQASLESVDSELDNLYAAWPHFFRGGQREQLCTAIGTFTHYLSVTGRCSYGVALLQDTLTRVESDPLATHDQVTAKLKESLGWLAFDCGQVEKAQEFLEQSLWLYTNLGLSKEQMVVLRVLGNICLQEGSFVEAKEFFERDLHNHKLVGDEFALGGSMNNLGFVYLQMGRFTEAEYYLGESVKIDRRLGALSGLANDLDSLGTLYLVTGRFRQAEQTFLESLNIVSKIGYLRLLPYVLNGLGRALYQQGSHKDGTVRVHEALLQAEKTGHERAVVTIATSLANIQLQAGDLQNAEKLLTRAITLADKFKLKAETFASFCEVSKLLGKQGKVETALRLALHIQNARGVWHATRARARELVDDLTRSCQSVVSDPQTPPLSQLDELVNDLVSANDFVSVEPEPVYVWAQP